MSVEECCSAEELAQLIHRYHGVLTGCFDGCTATLPWKEVDPHQRRLMIATARLVLSDLAAKQHAGEAATDPLRTDSTDSTPESDRRYFAKPGQAEWGC